MLILLHWWSNKKIKKILNIHRTNNMTNCYKQYDGHEFTINTIIKYCYFSAANFLIVFDPLNAFKFLNWQWKVHVGMAHTSPTLFYDLTCCWHLSKLVTCQYSLFPFTWGYFLTFVTLLHASSDTLMCHDTQLDSTG